MRLLIILLSLSLMGCGSISNAIRGESNATITVSDNGKMWTVKAKSDALVEFAKDKDGAVKIKVDNRGAPSPISEAIAGIIVVGAQKTDIRIDGD